MGFWEILGWSWIAYIGGSAAMAVLLYWIFKRRTFLILLIGLFPAIAFAHPGGLDAKGCHRVFRDWVYKSGRIADAGTYHCHRPLGLMPFDKKEALRDSDDTGKEKSTKGWWENMWSFWLEENK